MMMSYSLLNIVGTQCWAFCPPGGLVSANLSAAMAPFCTSVIMGKVNSTMPEVFPA